MIDTARSDEAFAAALGAWMDRAANTANNDVAACRDAAGGSKRYASYHGRIDWKWTIGCIQISASIPGDVLPKLPALQDSHLKDDDQRQRRC